MTIIDPSRFRSVAAPENIWLPERDRIRGSTLLHVAARLAASRRSKRERSEGVSLATRLLEARAEVWWVHSVVIEAAVPLNIHLQSKEATQKCMMPLEVYCHWQGWRAGFARLHAVARCCSIAWRPADDQATPGSRCRSAQSQRIWRLPTQSCAAVWARGQCFSLSMPLRMRCGFFPILRNSLHFFRFQ